MAVTVTMAVEGPLDKDPDVREGGCVTLERADGRSVWRQRFVVANRFTDRDGNLHYVLRAVDACFGF